MTDLERAAIRDQCRQLLADYAIAVDGADADAMVACFTADGVLARGSLVLRGAAELPRVLEGRAPGNVMRHLLATQSVSVAPNGRSARALCYYVLYSAAGEDEPLPMPEPFSLGDWNCELADTGQGWKLARLEIRRRFARPRPQ